MESKILTIMFTDIKDFTHRTRIQSREQHLIMLERHEALIQPFVQKHKGKIIKNLGDSFLIVFESPTNSLLAASEIQNNLVNFNKRISNKDEKIELRIGINSGEVYFSQVDVTGDAVNVAARVVGLAQENQIYFTEAVYLTMNRSEIRHVLLGEKHLKGIGEPIKMYRVLLPHEEANTAESSNLEQPSSMTFQSPADIPPSAEFQESKFDETQIDKVFDFTNIEFEKKYTQAVTSPGEDQNDSKADETLELDTKKYTYGVSDGKDQSDESKDTQLEHSKELLMNIREEKKKEKITKKTLLLFLLIFSGILAFLYFFLTTQEKETSPEIKDSPVLEAINPKPTPNSIPTATRFKPVKDIGYATLKIKTSPSGAIVWLGNKKLSGLTPITIRKVQSKKSFLLSIRKRGYRPHEILLNLDPREEKEIEVELTKR